jgi:hypothetical protein
VRGGNCVVIVESAVCRTDFMRALAHEAVEMNDKLVDVSLTRRM